MSEKYVQPELAPKAHLQENGERRSRIATTMRKTSIEISSIRDEPAEYTAT
jgi:hypothetical protein